MTKYVIINADDFGLSPGINRGIIEAFHAGGLSSTSIMVQMPGFKDAVKLAYASPELGIGLHFNLTYGYPISPPERIPSLVQQSGAFRDITNFCPDSELDITTELEAQWDRLLLTGLTPTHLDSHHLLHQRFPSIYNVMSAFASAKQIPLRRTQSSHERADSQHMKTDHILLDTYDNPDSLNRLIGYIREAPDGVTEITCHPGYSDQTLRNVSTWTAVRDAEQAVFCHPAVQQTIQDHHIRLISYKSLKDALLDQTVSLAPPATEPDSPAIEPPPIVPPAHPAVKKRRKPGARRRKKRSAGRRKPTGGKSGASKYAVSARKKKRAPSAAVVRSKRRTRRQIG